MSTATERVTRGGRTNHASRDHYQEVTDRIIAALEAGTPPWRDRGTLTRQAALRCRAMP
ncbi:MAG TPA: ArdC family protein [Acetobacteraceae bacterium]